MQIALLTEVSLTFITHTIEQLPSQRTSLIIMTRLEVEGARQSALDDHHTVELDSHHIKTGNMQSDVHITKDKIHFKMLIPQYPRKS